ncbi:transposase [Anaerosinus massiliensis]|uniref:transposase n=1 Tax=Massilibacillus massiliensis TaxID=1806837 RepID=UPI000DA62FCD|nr:transposase [Massilibacillus massiliensis]
MILSIYQSLKIISKKTVKTQLGEINVKIPRDRNGEYEPQIIAKYNCNADGMEEKILSFYACGMSQRDIAEQIKISTMLKFLLSL